MGFWRASFWRSFWSGMTPLGRAVYIAIWVVALLLLGLSLTVVT